MHDTLTINPSKLSQPAGAALALMGIKDMIPLWHGVQGCTAFAKNLFISHFHEPMPFQNTAISQTNVIMGGDGNIIEALDHLKDLGKIIGVITTGVSETSGVDLDAVLKTFTRDNPDTTLVYTNTPDFEGSLESGYAKATEALLKSLAQHRNCVNPRQVAVFPGPYFTPGEIEFLRDTIRDFGMTPLICPDLGDSLFGYLRGQRFSATSIGGITVDEIRSLPESTLALSLGSSMEKLAARFGAKYDIRTLHYDNLATLSEMDHFFQTLEWVSGRPTPEKYQRQREHYLDTLLDTDFFFHGKRAVVAGDTEFVRRWKLPLELLDVKTIGISSLKAEGLELGDYSDFSRAAIDGQVHFVVGNTHVARIADELKIPAIRCGIPVTDRFGEPQTTRIGYEGASRQLMECANAAMHSLQHPTPFVSPSQAALE